MSYLGNNSVINQMDGLLFLDLGFPNQNSTQFLFFAVSEITDPNPHLILSLIVVSYCAFEF